MKTRTRLAGVMGATTAFALVPAAAAYAHDTASAPQQAPMTVGPQATSSTLIRSTALTPFARLDDWASALKAAATAVPDSTVLHGRSRVIAAKQIAAATATSARLGTLTGLTDQQQALVTDTRAKLAAAVAQLRALLANRETPAPVTAAPTTVTAVAPTAVVAATDDRDGRGFCDAHHDGSFGNVGFHGGDRSWDGDHHRHSRGGFRT